jgi:hypothetical protein
MDTDLSTKSEMFRLVGLLEEKLDEVRYAILESDMKQALGSFLEFTDKMVAVNDMFKTIFNDVEGYPHGN